MTAMAPLNEHEARELALYVCHDRDLYLSQIKPALAVMARHGKARRYDPDKALRLWGRVARAGAFSYRRDFGPIYGGFSPATRQVAAVQIADHFADELAELIGGAK